MIEGRWKRGRPRRGKGKGAQKTYTTCTSPHTSQKTSPAACRFLERRTGTPPTGPSPQPLASIVRALPALVRPLVILTPRQDNAGVTRLSAQPRTSGDRGKPGAFAASPARSRK